MGQVAFVDAGAAASPPRKPLEEAVEANWLATSPGRASLFASPVPSPFPLPVGPSFTAGRAEICKSRGAEAGAEPEDCAEGIPVGIADKTGIAVDTGDAGTEAVARSLPEPSSRRTKLACGASAFQAFPKIGGCAATTAIPRRLAAAEACPTDSPDFFSPDALAGTLLLAMGAAPAFFPPAGKLVVGETLAAGADGKAERAGAPVAACAPTNCSISKSPNDAAGAAVAAGISEVAATGLSAVTGTGAINPSASGTAGLNKQLRGQASIAGGKSWRSGETAWTQAFCRRDDKVKERLQRGRRSWLGKACLLDWANHACPRPRRSRCSSSSIACSRRCCLTRYSRHCTSRSDSSTSRFCRSCR